MDEAMRCPKCLSESLETTTAGGIVGPDMNWVTCHSCGWKGIAEFCKKSKLIVDADPYNGAFLQAILNELIDKVNFLSDVLAGKYQ